MVHNLATWKTLEDMMIELKKKGATIPANIIEDLRSAKSMIKLSCTVDSQGGEAVQKAEEYMANVEAYLVTEGEKAFDSEYVDRWLQRLEEASAEVCEIEEPIGEGKFVTGVPRDQKWIRIEPTGDLSIEKVGTMASELNLQVKAQRDGKLVVYGQPDNLKQFIKKMTAQQQNNKKIS